MYSQRSKRAYARRMRRNPTRGEKATRWLYFMGYRAQRVTPSGYIADWYNAPAKVIIEIDGPQHKRRRGYDRVRDRSHRRQHRIYTLRVSSTRAGKSHLILPLEVILTTVLWYLYQAARIW